MPTLRAAIACPFAAVEWSSGADRMTCAHTSREDAMKRAVHSIFVLLGITLAGISMFAVAVAMQIILMPNLSSAGLIWYYLIWFVLYTVLIVILALRTFRRP